MIDHQDETRRVGPPQSRELPVADARRKPPPPSVVVRYGRMNLVGEFLMPRGFRSFSCGTRVVVQTDRGVEIGEPLSLTCTGCKNGVSKDHMRSYAKRSGPDFLRLRVGRVLREATDDDLVEEKHILAQKDEKTSICRRLIAKHELDMKLVDCEHIFGGERIVFYFMAESRVDFRGLVRDLADEFQTRIEMRQIGARDEARLVADYETCGRECCCKNFLKTLKPVSMRMAKLQKATLDPSKVSGRCGRLKCCLRYEHASYEELDRKLPRVGEQVNTPEGMGVVIERQILTQLLRVQGDEGRSFVVGVEALLEPGETPGPQSEGTETPAAGDLADNEWMLPERSALSQAADHPEQPFGAPEGRGSQPSGENGESTGKPRRRKRRRGRRGRRRKGARPGNAGAG